jgi:hypothetical protein
MVSAQTSGRSPPAGFGGPCGEVVRGRGRLTRLQQVLARFPRRSDRHDEGGGGIGPRPIERRVEREAGQRQHRENSVQERDRRLGAQRRGGQSLGDPPLPYRQTEHHTGRHREVGNAEHGMAWLGSPHQVPNGRRGEPQRERREGDRDESKREPSPLGALDAVAPDVPDDDRRREDLDQRITPEPDQRKRAGGDPQGEREDRLADVPRDGRVLETKRKPSKVVPPSRWPPRPHPRAVARC